MNRTKKSLSLFLSAGLAASVVSLACPGIARADGLCGDTSQGFGSLGTGTDTAISGVVGEPDLRGKALAGVVRWRRDALNSSEALFDGKTIRQVLAEEGISEAAYLAPQWSYQLERDTIQRAAEANLRFDHVRPNGESWSTLQCGGVDTNGEILAQGWGDHTTIADAIEQWASEKANVTSGQGVTGHYLMLINPELVSYGFGTVGRYAAGWGSTQASTNTGQTSWTGSCTFTVPALAANVSASMNPSSAVVGQSKNLGLAAQYSVADDFGRQKVTTVQLRGTISSGTPTVASVSGTTVKAVSPGASSLSIASGDQNLPLGRFTVVARAIASVPNPPVITTPSGTAPTLPSTLTATWNDGATSRTAVSWGAVPTTWQNRADGSFAVSGTVSGWAKAVTAQVKVTPARVSSSSTVAVTTPAGVRPSLPATVPVVWSNGDSTREAVVWDAVPTTAYAQRNTSFTVLGTVGGTRLARAAVSVANPVVRSTAQPAISVLQNRTPALPANVRVSWSDGSSTQQPVTWATVDRARYAAPGTVTITGTVTLPNGTGRTTATVTVRPAGFSPVVGQRPAPSGRIGEATGDAYADIWGLTAAGQLDFHRYTPGRVTRVGLRGEGLERISYLGVATDQNGDRRADLFYRDSRDQSLWFAYNLGNGYLKQGVQVGARWGQMDQIWYAGQMVAGSSKQFILARNKTDGSLWRYTISPTGLYGGTRVGTHWQDLRVMLSPGNMYGDAAWDVVGIHVNGNLYGYKSVNGKLAQMGVVGQRWGSITKAFSPGDITGDGRLDMIAQHTSGDLYAYGNTPTRWTDIGRIGSGFGGYRIMA